MNTCQHCRYWERERPPSTRDTAPLFGYCLSPKMKDDIFEATAVSDMLLTPGKYGSAAAMKTGQDFGCIHWQARDKAQ
jgi:hypothetical protein